jgi:Transposase DDE domain group 1
MPAQCNPVSFAFAPLGRQKVVAGFDGGVNTSDTGALLLGMTDRAIGLIARFAACFKDARSAALIEHQVETLVGQRVFGLAMGYEDLNDHDGLRHDPVMALLAGKLKAARRDCAPVAGKSTLNRLELSGLEATDYHKIGHDGAAIERLLVDVFLEAHRAAPPEIVLDFDATDDPLHGRQEGRFFHGYYDCYCYLPLYVFCGGHLLAAKQRQANSDASAGAKEEAERIVAHIRTAWPSTRIILRADSGFAREELMGWCEANGVDYVFGLARNERLAQKIEAEMTAAQAEARETGKPARRFKDFPWITRKSWSRERRVVAKAEWLGDKANPRFVVTSLTAERAEAQNLYEDLYCARGDMENRIKEAQGDLFGGRTSTRSFRANQLRLWFSAMAYVLLQAFKRIALQKTKLAKAAPATIRLKLLKIGAQITVSLRRIKIAMAAGFPLQEIFAAAHHHLAAAVRA